MQLSFNPQTPNFKALLVAPSGLKAIENTDNRPFLYGVGSYIRKEAEKRENDKYVDGIVTGTPDEYGRYWPVLTIHDKVTGENLRSDFSVETPQGHFGYHECYSQDGRLLPENVTKLTDVNGNTRYFTFNDYTEAGGFVYTIEHNNNLQLQCGVLEAMEKYYRDSFETGKLPKDKYATLVVKLKEQYRKPFHKVVPEIIKDENLIGQGREKNVYKIDKMPDYVLCVLKDNYNPDKPISPFYQCFQTNNIKDIDEPILMNDNGMFVKKYTKGESHSLPNWINKYRNIEPLSYDDIKLFTSQLEVLSTFPTKSYVKFAKDLQKLNQERIRIDTINPNNILINKDTNEINLIDMPSDDNNVPLGIFRPINSLSDMEAILLDSMMYMRYYNMATDEDKLKLDELAKKIIEKCEIAQKVSNIGNSPRNTEMYLRNFDETTPMAGNLTRVEILQNFRNHFDGIMTSEEIDPQKQFNRKMYGHD